MIVTPLEDSLRIVTQADHARFAAELLGLFRIDAVRLHPRRALLLRAVAEHDNGWWEFDAAPAPDADGMPPDFRSIGEADRCEIWRRGVARHATSEPAVAALVATHALRLLGGKESGGPGRSEFLAELEERRDGFAREGGLDAAEIGSLDRWMELADALALAAALGSASPVVRDELQAEVRESDGRIHLALSPLPLAGATRLILASRRIARRHYDSAADLGGALATARWEGVTVLVGPPGRA